MTDARLLKAQMDAMAVGTKELAEELGVRTQSIRRARLDPSASGYRPAPAGWEAALLRLSLERLRKIWSLALPRRVRDSDDQEAA